MDPHAPQNPPQGYWRDPLAQQPPMQPQQPPQGNWQAPPVQPPQGDWRDPLAQAPTPQPGYTQYPSPPPYSNQPNFTYQPGPRSKKGLWIGIGSGVALVLIIVSIATYMYQTSPVATLNRYCDALHEYDAIKLYETISKDQKSDFNLAVMQKSFDLLKKEGAVATCHDVSIDHQSDSTATGKLTISWTGLTSKDYGMKENETNSAVLIKEDGQWKIQSMD